MLSHQLMRTRNALTEVLINQSISLSNQVTDNARTLSLSNVTIGDMLVAMTARRTATPPTLASGWTDIITSATTARSLRVQFKIATSTTESIAWTGAYGYMVALKNARVIGKTAKITDNDSGTTQPIPDLTALDTSGTSLILAGGWATSVTIETDPPFTILYPDNAPTAGCAVYIQGNTEAIISGKNFKWSATGDPASYAVEVLK